MDLHKVENGTGCLSTLSTQHARHNGGQPIHKLEQGDQRENGRNKTDDLWYSLSVSELGCERVDHTGIVVKEFTPVVPENQVHGAICGN